MKTTVKSIFAAPEQFADKTVKVSGWIRTIRASNAFGFIEINDGTFFKNIQVVFESEILENKNQITPHERESYIGI